MSRISRCFTVVSFIALLAACGPKDVSVPDLGITVTTPKGWSVEMSKASLDAGEVAEIKKGKKTFGFISKDVSIPLGANDDAWPKAGPHTLEQLQAALAPLKPDSPESFESGFGVRYVKDGKPKFLYVVTVGGQEYECTANDWIAEEDVPDAISICKSIRG